MGSGVAISLVVSYVKVVGIVVVIGGGGIPQFSSKLLEFLAITSQPSSREGFQVPIR